MVESAAGDILAAWLLCVKIILKKVRERYVRTF
jgi:hypothetical protein